MPSKSDRSKAVVMGIALGTATINCATCLLLAQRLSLGSQSASVYFQWVEVVACVPFLVSIVVLNTGETYKQKRFFFAGIASLVLITTTQCCCIIRTDKALSFNRFIDGVVVDKGLSHNHNSPILIIKGKGGVETVGVAEDVWSNVLQGQHVYKAAGSTNILFSEINNSK